MLGTERLRLEPLDPVHAEGLFQIYGEPAVSRYLISRPTSRSEFDVIFERALGFRDSHGMWAVVRRADGALLGRLGFFAFGAQERPELAFLLTTSAWGRGIATEACRAAIRHALDAHDWPELVAVVRPGNRASIRLLEKLGFSTGSSLRLEGEAAILHQASRQRLWDVLTGAVDSAPGEGR